MKQFLLVTLLFAISFLSEAQVAINTTGTSADANTMLDVKSTSKGVKFPRMTTVQRKAITTTSEDLGLMVFDTDKQALYMFDGTEWLPFAMASANPLSQVKKVTPAANDHAGAFGDAVDISGDYAVVGAYGDNNGSNVSTGSISIYHKENGFWKLQTKLNPPAEQSAFFGGAVSIDGDYVAVGAIGTKVAGVLNQGAVYIYHRTGENWQFQQMFTGLDVMSNANFGTSVNLEGARLLVGAERITIGANAYQGAVYVFTRTGVTWTQQLRLTAPDGGVSDYFGSSVASHGDNIVVGASRAASGVIRPGAAYVFTKSGGTYAFQKKLTNTVEYDGMRFGYSVAIIDNVISVGAPFLNANGKKGGVYIYQKTGIWTLTKVLDPENLAPGTPASFGFSLQAHGEYLMIGAKSDMNTNDFSAGSVYVYKLSGLVSDYLPFKRIVMEDGVSGDDFGKSIGFDGTNFIIGVPSALRSANSTFRGQVYFGSLD